MSAYVETAGKVQSSGTTEFLLKLIPTTFVGAFANGDVLQVLVIAIMAGCALSLLGEPGRPLLHLIEQSSHMLFKMMFFIVKLAPLGVLGAIAFTVGQYGVGSLKQLGYLVALFYATVALFVVVVLGGVLRMAGFSIFKFLAYKEDFQAVDIATIAKPLTKMAVTVMEPAQVPRAFQQAFHLMRSGRPGPVLIDLPFDVQMAEIEFDPDTYSPLPVYKPAATRAQIDKALAMLNEAQRPLIVAGGGIINAEASGLLVELAELTGIPVIPTLMGWGVIPDDHPLMAGMCGLQTSHRYGNATMLASDFVLGIGNRWANRHAGSPEVYCRGRKFVHVDIEPTQIGRVFPPDYGIVLQVALYGQPFEPPCLLLSGGETTVTVRGPGRGGRNVEFLLSLGVALDGCPGIHAIAGDTDGVDGLEEIAGAYLAPDTLARAWASGINPRSSLAVNDGHGFFEALGDSVVTGPTLTNVNDFRAILVTGAAHMTRRS